MPLASASGINKNNELALAKQNNAAKANTYIFPVPCSEEQGNRLSFTLNLTALTISGINMENKVNKKTLFDQKK